MGVKLVGNTRGSPSEPIASTIRWYFSPPPAIRKPEHLLYSPAPLPPKLLSDARYAQSAARLDYRLRRAVREFRGYGSPGLHRESGPGAGFRPIHGERLGAHGVLLAWGGAFSIRRRVPPRAIRGS